MSSIYRRKRAESSNAKLLEQLPGELRNYIFEFCIHDAFISAKSKKGITQSQPSLERSPLNISALPRWSGPGQLRVTGVGPLPILFLNKKLHDEVSSLVYSTVNEVSIGGYILQYPQEDPTARWRIAFDLLERVPYIFTFTTNIKVTLPRVQTELFRRHWNALGVRQPSPATSLNGWAMIPSLVEFLKKFEYLSVLDIVITIDGNQAPDFEPVLSLLDLCKIKVFVTFKGPEILGAPQGWDDSWPVKWDIEWNKWLLVKKGDKFSASTVERSCRH